MVPSHQVMTGRPRYCWGRTLVAATAPVYGWYQTGSPVWSTISGPCAARKISPGAAAGSLRRTATDGGCRSGRDLKLRSGSDGDDTAGGGADAGAHPASSSAVPP